MPQSQENHLVQYEDVYYVEIANQDRLINPIAIRPTIIGDRIEWGNTGRGAYREFKEIRLIPENASTPEKIQILSQKNEQITLTLLNLDTYNHLLKPYVAGHPTFNSDEEVRRYYLMTNFD